MATPIARPPTAMAEAEADAGSYRDPSGHVYTFDGQIYRTVLEPAVPAFEALRASGLLDELVGRRWLVDTEEAPRDAIGPIGEDAAYLVRHQRIPFISYPYEWPFSALKAAALFHLDMQLMVLERGFSLTDASAYNVQFTGTRPIFIDLLSFHPYTPGEYWAGYRQFCEQFLIPLLMRAYLGVPHNAWLRGSPDGIPVAEFVRILPLMRRLSPKVFLHLVVQARLSEKARRSEGEAITKVRQGKLSQAGYRGILTQLRGWIEALRPPKSGISEWGNYAESNSYQPQEYEAKRSFIAAFAGAVRPQVLMDLGCNTGDFSIAALQAGAGYAVGFDGDQQALDRAFARARKDNHNFLPLHMDLANPSPDQGWRQAERKGFGARGRVDGLIALALIHHLAIARNIPLDQAIAWLASLAPAGIIEFVPKDDPTVQTMLALREDIFPNYTEDNFAALLARHGRIAKSSRVSGTGRTLFWYER